MMFNDIYLPSCCVTIRNSSSPAYQATVRNSTRNIDKGMYESLLALFDNEETDEEKPEAANSED